MQSSPEESLPNHYFILFINSKSGGRKGSKFLSIGQELIRFKHRHGFEVHLFLYDLFIIEDRKRGLEKVKEYSLCSENVNVIICGGDGTILWVVNEVIKVGIDPEKVCFGVIPIGTGNDFSRSLGWGGYPIKFSKDNLSELKETIDKWIKAKKENFDLWDVKIKTYPGGSIKFPSGNYLENEAEEYERTFSNYLGIGIDARVSYRFEEKRTRSKYLNLILYACLGFCFLFQKTPKINNHLVEFSEEGPNYGADSAKYLDEDRNNEQLIQGGNSENYGLISLRKQCRGLVCLNSTSYMSGVFGIFNSSKITSKEKKEKDFKEASFNDGKLEFVSFNNELSLGLERFVHMAGKVTQGGGPYCLKFEEIKCKTFIQIDGEAFNVTMLKEISIEKSKLTKSGQIRVLARTEE